MRMHVQIQKTIFLRTRTYAENLLRMRMHAQNHLSFILLLTRMHAENPLRMRMHAENRLSFPKHRPVLGESMRAPAIL